jgi:DNA polymerase-3 subunit gamma/tau
VARTKKTTAAVESVDVVAAGPKFAEEPAHYTVVARRYRPQQFEDVVGQDHVVQALRNAINLNLVTHAYLFSGTRGVGKTSIARIFAKCLNCVKGPTDQPCLECDICRAIAVGQDVDVIEIDGASNNGVEAVRELRQNAGLRPSRARFKIYYIDEVHMLSTGAFNALLKTLEEPPEHVKFFFATTEAHKIPVTVLSRCQRYDFAGIAPEQIVESLAAVCAGEGVEADRAALAVVARRAAGSMRDAQSLLERLLSYGGRTITADLAHQALGIAPDDRVLELLEALAARDPAQVLRLVDASAAAGIQPVDLLDGVLEFLRDAMVLTAGASVPALAAAPAQRDRLKALADRWTIDAILAALQILDAGRGRLRGSSHGRLIVELSLCRAARLENLADLGEMIGKLAAIERSEPAAHSASKKKITPDRETAPTRPTPPPDPAPTVAAPTPPRANGAADDGHAQTVAPLALDDVLAVWSELPGRVGPGFGIPLSLVRPTALEASGRLVIRLPREYNWVAAQCGTRDGLARIEGTLRELLSTPITVRFDQGDATAAPAPAVVPPPPAPAPPDELATDPLVRQVIELFEARRIRVDVEDDGSAA